jgi:predicted phosphate transport protein (TIGR00153 family)
MRLLPKNENFYELFAEIAQRVSGAAVLLHQLFEDPANRSSYVAQIKRLEHEADYLTHDVIIRIDKTFVTPFDREDIHSLVSELDDVVDLIDGTARRAEIFDITDVYKPAVVLSEVIVRAAAAVEEAVRGMKDAKLVKSNALELKRLEEEGDAIYHEAMGALFSDTADPIEVIKWKELYDKLEDTLDQCEDVANVLQSIAIKNN